MSRWITPAHPYTRRLKELEFSNNLHTALERRIIEHDLQSPPKPPLRLDRLGFAWFLMARPDRERVIDIAAMTDIQFDRFVREHAEWRERSPASQHFVMVEEVQREKRVSEERRQYHNLLTCKYPDTLHDTLERLRTRARIRMWPFDGLSRGEIKWAGLHTELEEGSMKIAELMDEPFKEFLAEHLRWCRIHPGELVAIEVDEQEAARIHFKEVQIAVQTTPVSEAPDFSKLKQAIDETVSAAMDATNAEDTHNGRDDRGTNTPG